MLPPLWQIVDLRKYKKSYCSNSVKTLLKWLETAIHRSSCCFRPASGIMVVERSQPLATLCWQLPHLRPHFWVQI